ncbi:MAG: hypothetical protein M3416_18980, partial [Acidobacteriota bacterium]|nr:hypothetical protein [Acidobacteriota bacterium]
MSEERNSADISQIIAENFGANATYVEGLWGRFRSDPALVDEAWRAYFAELLGETEAGNGGGGAAASPAPAADATTNGRPAVERPQATP